MNQVLNKSPFDGRLYTQAEYDTKHGTYANKSTDTSGLGEYSDAQLLKELVDRGIVDKVVGRKMKEKNAPFYKISTAYGYTKGWNSLRTAQRQLIKEIIG